MLALPPRALDHLVWLVTKSQEEDGVRFWRLDENVDEAPLFYVASRKPQTRSPAQIGGGIPALAPPRDWWNPHPTEPFIQFQPQGMWAIWDNRLFDIKGSKPIPTTHESLERFDPAGNWILDRETALRMRAVSGWDNTHFEEIRLFRVADCHPDAQPKPIVVRLHDTKLTRLFFSSNGEWLAAIGTENRVFVWRLNGFHPSNVVEFVTGAALKTDVVLFGPSGDWLLAARIASEDFDSFNSPVGVTDLPTVESRLWNLRGTGFAATPDLLSRRDCEVSPDGRLLAFVSDDGDLNIEDVVNDHTAVIPGLFQDDNVSLTQLSPHSEWLVVATSDPKTSETTAHVWSVGQGRDPALHLTVDGLFGPKICFSPDDALMVCPCIDTKLRVWRLRDTAPADSGQVFPGSTSWTRNSLSYRKHWPSAFSPDNRWFAQANGWSVKLRDLTDPTRAPFTSTEMVICVQRRCSSTVAEVV